MRGMQATSNLPCIGRRAGDSRPKAQAHEATVGASVSGSTLEFVVDILRESGEVEKRPKTIGSSSTQETEVKVR